MALLSQPLYFSFSNSQPQKLEATFIGRSTIVKMDFALRCNSLKCRTQLTEQAVVTTCRYNTASKQARQSSAALTISSHIFCTACSNHLGLSVAVNGQRNCPACQTSLLNPDDVVESQLNPTEDYKTSVLSGLTPITIMECAGRGLSFYSYQATQEM